jgi:hypothetical protein
MPLASARSARNEPEPARPLATYRLPENAGANSFAR